MIFLVRVSSCNYSRSYNHALAYSGAFIENNKTAYGSQQYKLPSKFFSEKVKDMTGPQALNRFFLYSLLLYYNEPEKYLDLLYSSGDIIESLQEALSQRHKIIEDLDQEIWSHDYNKYLIIYVNDSC